MELAEFIGPSCTGTNSRPGSRFQQLSQHKVIMLPLNEHQSFNTLSPMNSGQDGNWISNFIFFTSPIKINELHFPLICNHDIQQSKVTKHETFCMKCVDDFRKLLFKFFCSL